MGEIARFHLIPQQQAELKTQRLLKRKSKPKKNRILIAADQAFIFCGRKKTRIENFRDLPAASYLTLTQMEADLIALANPGQRPPRSIEKLYPWLPIQVYVENAEQNFTKLKSVMRKFEKHFFSPTEYCNKLWNTVCNAIGEKTNLDRKFYAAWHMPVQDCFVLEEKRPDRVIVALDFNGMYPSCMQQNFPKPSQLRFKLFNRNYKAGEQLSAGLYRCELYGIQSNFIQKYNPFRTFFAGRHLRPSLSKPLTVDLHEFEIPFYQRHFSKVHLLDAVVSDVNIPHPLAKEARRLFARRKHYKNNGNKALADREKFLSTLLSSCTQRPLRQRIECSSYLNAEHYLKENYGLSSASDDPSGLDAVWLRRGKGVKVEEVGRKIKLNVPDLDDGNACYLFNQRIVARGRVVLLEMMEKITSVSPDVEICYVNADSIHFSIHNKDKQAAMDRIYPFVSEELGGCKIEAVVTGGLWLEPGRYWLYTDKIQKYRNKSIRNRKEPFKDHAVHVINKRLGELNFPIRLSISMQRSMSGLRSIEHDPYTGLKRQKLLEIDENTPATEILEQIERNFRHGIPIRMNAFYELSRRSGTVGTRCLGTQRKGLT